MLARPISGRKTVAHGTSVFANADAADWRNLNLALIEDGELVYLAQNECPELMRALARPGASAAYLFCRWQGLSGLYATQRCN